MYGNLYHLTERERERERREREEREKRRDDRSTRLAKACVQRLVHSRDNNTEQRDPRRARGDDETKHRAPLSSLCIHKMESVATPTAEADVREEWKLGFKEARQHFQKEDRVLLVSTLVNKFQAY